MTKGTEVLGEERERLRFEDAMLPLRLEERPRDKGHRWPTEAGKGKEARSPLEPPEGT